MIALDAEAEAASSTVQRLAVAGDLCSCGEPLQTLRLVRGRWVGFCLPLLGLPLGWRSDLACA